MFSLRQLHYNMDLRRFRHQLSFMNSFLTFYHIFNFKNISHFPYNLLDSADILYYENIICYAMLLGSPSRFRKISSSFRHASNAEVRYHLSVSSPTQYVLMDVA